MHSVYLVCLVVGFLLSVMLAVLGDAHFGMGGHHVAGHDTSGIHHGGDVAHNVVGMALGFLSPVSLAGAALLFGGAGLLVGSSALGLPVAIVAAVVGAIALRLLMRTFISSSTSPLGMTADGAIGTVNATILPGAPGEVAYTLEGLYRTAIAKSDTGERIPRGTQVVITRREGGFAWVTPLDPLETSGARKETQWPSQ